MPHSHDLKLNHPLVLIHGLGARNKFGPVDYFYKMVPHFEKHENRVLVADLPGWNSIEKRAEILANQITQKFGEEKVNLMGHSMGGLDARFLAAQPLFKERVSSVTTIGTPNLGTCLVDHLNDVLPKPLRDKVNSFIEPLGLNNQGIEHLNREHMKNEFSKNVEMMSDVGYFSAMTVISKPIMKSALPIFWLTHGIIEKIEGENDGFVSLESSKLGEHIITEYGDHYAQIGQPLGRTRGLKYLHFYDSIIKRLKKEGF